MDPVVAYHDKPSASHRSRIDELHPAGYRLVALNVSGEIGDPR